MGWERRERTFPGSFTEELHVPTSSYFGVLLQPPSTNTQCFPPTYGKKSCSVGSLFQSPVPSKSKPGGKEISAHAREVVEHCG